MMVLNVVMFCCFLRESNRGVDLSGVRCLSLFRTWSDDSRNELVGTSWDPRIVLHVELPIYGC